MAEVSTRQRREGSERREREREGGGGERERGRKGNEWGMTTVIIILIIHA